MSKVLFISDASPFSFNHSGAASFKTSHLMLLNEMENLDIYLLTFPGNAGSTLQEITQTHAFKPRNTSFLNASFLPGSIRYPLYKTVCKFILNTNPITRESILFPSINPGNVDVLQKLIYDLKPDMIWAEHLECLLLTSHLKDFKGRVVYSHHDFLWKLILIRRKKIKDFVQALLYYIIQKRAVQRFGKYVVGGASNELLEIKNLCPKSTAIYLPTLYPILSPPEYPELSMPLRIVHLGSPKATANHIGVKNLLGKIIPELQNKIDFQCHMIGTPNVCNKLFDQPNVVCEGFVKDLKTVLRPFDIHILPYDKATGSRTRYAVAMNHSQVLVAHRAAVEGIEGLISHQNCIIEDSLKGITEAIIRLYNNPSERIRLGQNAKKWHDQTHQIQQNAMLLRQWLQNNSICHV